MYTYPDGTQSTLGPRDGEYFKVADRNEKGIYQEKTYQWDGLLHQWFLITKTPYQDLVTKHLPNKCECGAEAVGSSKHDKWCKKFHE